MSVYVGIRVDLCVSMIKRNPWLEWLEIVYNSDPWHFVEDYWFWLQGSGAQGRYPAYRISELSPNLRWRTFLIVHTWPSVMSSMSTLPFKLAWICVYTECTFLLVSIYCWLMTEAVDFHRINWVWFSQWSPMTHVSKSCYDASKSPSFARECVQPSDVGTECQLESLRHSQLQSNHHHQLHTNLSFFYRPNALPVTHQQCQSTAKSFWIRMCSLIFYNLFVYMLE